jgi:hypothetical protein
LGKVLIAKNEVAINTAQASVEKRAMPLQSPQNQESIITLKR